MSSSPAECILVYIWWDFSRAKIDLRKTREREFATLDLKIDDSGIAESYARNIEGKNRGGRDDSCYNGLSRRSWKVKV